ncbi:hypothetical protein LIER_17522 [Lithospermum erythrorhizon]|uniref:Pentatricopeptide repeat-containing protein n=1 Tax=Lithospermum erythrorhizon TaxID=34254 RepID=A0AAV3QDC4_LITER
MDIVCKSGKPLKAVMLYKVMKKKGIELDVVAYNTVIRDIGILDGVDTSIRILKEMIELGCQPNVVTYNMVLKLYCEVGKYRDMISRPVLTIWKKIEEHGVSPDEFVYNALIDALVQKGMIDMARMYDEEMFKKGLSAKPRAELESKPATVTRS